MTIVGIKWLDIRETIAATLLGVLWAAIIGYIVWIIQQWQDKRVTRNRLSINLKDEINTLKQELSELKKEKE